MSNQKHTPGPWTWNEDFRGLDAPEGAILEFDRYDGMWLTYVDGRKANARLIAAAPDLLEALKAIKELAKPGQSLGISDAIDLICDIYNVALKALPTGGDD